MEQSQPTRESLAHAQQTIEDLLKQSTDTRLRRGLTHAVKAIGEQLQAGVTPGFLPRSRLR